MLAGGRGVFGVYYLLENIIHYFTTNLQGGKTAVKGGKIPPFPPTRKYPGCVNVPPPPMCGHTVLVLYVSA